MSQQEPDWARLRRIGDAIGKLQAEGRWTKDAYERVLAKAEEAARGQNEFIEFVLNERDPSWYPEG